MTMKRVLPLLVTGLLTAFFPPGTLADTQLYKYTDEQGRIHYTDRPPVDRQAETLDIRIKSYKGPVRVMDYAAMLAPDKADSRVNIYTTDWCGVCKKAKRYLDSQQIRYTEHDIEKSQKAKREFDRLGGKGLPVIVVGRQKMHGFSPQRLDAMIASQ